ncbi:MAG: EamA family transporter [Bordetella sp.]|nr:MAG: EamA family transporter [Bordetella sp.]
MPFTHLLLALLVVFIWGTNFVIIKLGLENFPPFLFATLRFIFSFLPWLFFVKKPIVNWYAIAGVGILMGVGQFGLLFWAMQKNISAGMASLVVQAQVFFTIIMSMFIYCERPKITQLIALSIATIGYIIVGWHSAENSQGSATTTLLGLFTVLLAAFSWSCVNLLIRSVGRVNMLGFMVWSSAYSVPILLILTVTIEGIDTILISLDQASWSGWLAVIWQALANTLFGFGVWNWLLIRHSIMVVAPTALLVPMFGIISSTWLLNESLPRWKIVSVILVLSGLAFNIYSDRRKNI